MGLFDELDNLDTLDTDRTQILKAPFGYPGGKTRSIFQILPKLPYYTSYVEPFGGGMSILLARKKSPLEVYNDAFGGVVDFYKCLRDPVLLEKMMEWLEHTVHSREDFYTCLDTWKDHKDLVERAARWFYTVQYSFGSKGKTFGRPIGFNGISGKVRNHVKEDFRPIHKRIQQVLIENLDYRQIIKDYDTHDTVFYCDPPYMDTGSGDYDNSFSRQDHVNLLALVFESKGFFALSGYPNELYDKYKWDATHSWTVFSSQSSSGHTKHLGKLHAVEKLWIKEAT